MALVGFENYGVNFVVDADRPCSPPASTPPTSLAQQVCAVCRTSKCSVSNLQNSANCLRESITTKSYPTLMCRGTWLDTPSPSEYLPAQVSRPTCRSRSMPRLEFHTCFILVVPAFPARDLPAVSSRPTVGSCRTTALETRPIPPVPQACVSSRPPSWHSWSTSSVPQTEAWR